VRSAEEIMNILEAYDLTGSFRDAGELAGCSHHTVARYVRAREEGRLVPGAAEPRPRLTDGYLDKLEELVERSKGKIRAGKAHRVITAMGFTGSERTTRRAVAKLKHAYHAGRRRVHRRWTC
jgi:flagellar biosynthesis/type III secretory pathway ATPase